MKKLPLIAPNPPKLSAHVDDLRRVEASGVFSNNGPEVRRFETDVNAMLFGGHGASLAVNNATIGLMLAIRHAAGVSRPTAGRLALMPALTFAATAQAAHWAGLTPLVCDVDARHWAACPKAEEKLLRQYGDRIAVIVPYATFGNAIDLERYAWLQRRFNVGVVIDAASSLGTLDEGGDGFGAHSPFATVFSLHATKTFAVGEGGLIHHGDRHAIQTMREMGNFGFQGSRSATVPGLNAKLPEVLAILANAKLGEIEQVCAHRAQIEAAYRAALSGVTLQQPLGARRAIQFMPALLPAELASRRAEIIESLAAEDIGCGTYFSPHLGEQPWMRDNALIEACPVADDVAGRMLSLPVTDYMNAADVSRIAEALARACTKTKPVAATPKLPAVASTLIVGGGPAGTALLTAATKRGLLPEFAAGLVMVERDHAIGHGRLGQYAITSDSTSMTFMTAVKDNAHPELAALVDHPAGRTVGGYDPYSAVPLTEAGMLIRATGERLHNLVEQHGGSVLTGHEVLGSQQTANGLWKTKLRRRSDGHEFELLSRNLVIATGGHQPLYRLARQKVAGRALVESVGGRLLQSDEVLACGGFDKVADLLHGVKAPKIAVIGGSTSAVSTMALLLKGRPSLPFGAGALSLLHRRPLRPFYLSAEAAEEDNFTDFGPQDVCPVSGFVYRLAGFRLESRELVLRMLGVNGRAPDPRVQLHRLKQGEDPEARHILDEADLVVAALGYRPHALPLSNSGGHKIALAADKDKPMVDGQCRVLADNGQPVPGLFGIGLAAGFVPHGALGGEESFSGQANGLWLWQNDVGLMIVDQVLEAAQQAAVA